MAKIRKAVQFLSALVMNANLGGFVSGRIYQGRLKRLCVPGLHCYSCPAAVGACPLGSLQLALGAGFRSPTAFPTLAYVLGLLLLFGALLGRVICGFLCPFGLVQELIHAPFGGLHRKRNRAAARRARFRYANYFVLVVFVLAFPVVAYAMSGYGAPAFCKVICPAGTLAGLPLLLTNPPLRGTLGLLFGWKALLLVCTAAACAVIFRPFCRICPLGAIYGLFNRFAVVGMAVDPARCTGCGGCSAVCPMQTQCSTAACIRCGRCATHCPASAVKFTFLSTSR